MKRSEVVKAIYREIEGPINDQFIWDENDLYRLSGGILGILENFGMLPPDYIKRNVSSSELISNKWEPEDDEN